MNTHNVVKLGLNDKHQFAAEAVFRGFHIQKCGNTQAEAVAKVCMEIDEIMDELASALNKLRVA